MPTEDKRRGKSLPSPVVPPDTVCFTIQVPNAVQYRAAFLQQISILGEWQTWDHPIDGTTCGDCETAAQLWRNALYYAVWSDECGGGNMSCEDVAGCIETDEATQTAINNIVNSTSNTQINYDTARQGTSLTLAERAASLTPPNPTCNEDVLFGSVSSIVDQLDKNNLDFLQIMEIGTNTRERVSTVVAAIPIIETLPVNEIIDFVDKAQQEILEHYEAQWTTALYDEYRCGIFCLALEAPDCEITFDLLFNYFNDKLGASLDPINFLQSLAEFFILGTWAGTEVVDIMMLIQLGVWREASNWLGVSLRTLETVGLLGANDPNNDWSVIPCECAPETPNISFIGTFAPSYDGTPQTFIGNTPTGGSTWDLTFQNISGTIAVAVTAVNAASNPICVRITSTTNVVSYQHNLCAGGAQTGTVENPSTEYGPNLGWFGASGGTVMRVTVEPI